MHIRHEKKATIRLVALASAACAAWIASSPAKAGGWADRAGGMNRREISEEDARKRSEGQEADRRNKLSIRRIRPAMSGVDWDADPTAIPYMLYQVNKRTELPVHIDNEGIDLASKEIFEYLVLYLTSHSRWALNEREAENLALWLKRGGTLVLDDCYLRGSGFSESVGPEVAKVIPASESIFLMSDDERVSDMFRMIYPTPWPGDISEIENRHWQYFLLDERPAVIFSPNDDGCAWEVSSPPTASNPLGEPIGHGGGNKQRELMYQWATNWMLFIYTH